jgi:hypothetical protein
MSAKSLGRLKVEVASWAAETRTFVAASRRLIEYFGSARELEKWDAALEKPLEWVSLVVAHTPTSARGRKALPPYVGGPTFRCSEDTARVISPLVEIVGGPIATFVYTIRRIFPKADQGRHLLPYGIFVASFADAVSHPMWTRHRNLAPDEWKAVFGKRPANRGLQRTALARRR